MGGKNCNGKTKGLAIQYIFHCFFENSREICIQSIFHDCLNLHKENARVFSTIGEVRSRQQGSVAASFVRVFWKSVLFFVMKKNCNGKTKGLAIQYIFHCCFENSRERCIQYIFHDCFEHSRGKCMEPHARHKCQIERSDVNVKDKCQI